MVPRRSAGARRLGVVQAHLVASQLEVAHLVLVALVLGVDVVDLLLVEEVVGVESRLAWAPLHHPLDGRKYVNIVL